MPAPLRVMIDARMLVGRFSGVSRVVTRLVEELAKRDDVRVIALCGSEPYAPWNRRDDIELVASTFGRRDRTACRRLFWEETRLPAIIRRAGVDLFHATWNSGIPARCPVPGILTIHDLIPWHNPKEHFTALAQRPCYRYSVRASARRAARVTTVSQYVRGEVLDRLLLDPRRVHAIPNGVDCPDFPATPRLDIDRPYVLYVGGHEPRKNIAGVFRAMARYWERFDASLELRLTGTPASLTADAEDAYRRLPPEAPVRYLGNPTDLELASQYASAEALLLLSKDEGFGLPALEAMAHGCPVIAAAQSSLPEVVADAGILVNPDDPATVSDAIHHLRNSFHDRSELLRRGLVRVHAFSWETMAESIYALYKNVLSESFRPHRMSRPVEPILAGTR